MFHFEKCIGWLDSGSEFIYIYVNKTSKPHVVHLVQYVPIHVILSI